MGSFPMKVSFVRPFPRSSKRVTSYASSIASCSIPNCAGSILFPFESEKYMEETIFSWGTISWYSPAFQNSCPSGVLMQQRNFPPAKIDLANRRSKTLRSPPLHHVLRVCPRLPNQFAWGIKNSCDDHPLCFVNRAFCHL